MYQLSFYSWLLQTSAVLISSYFHLPVLQPRCYLVIIVSCSNIILILGRSRYQLFQLPINFMECFSTAYLFLHGVTDTCSFLDAPFFTAKVFFGEISQFFVSYIIYRPNAQAMGVYDEFCLVGMLQPITNLLIGGEHIG